MESEDRRKLFKGLKPFAIESIVLKQEITGWDQITEADRNKLEKFGDYRFQRMNEARRRYEASTGQIF